MLGKAVSLTSLGLLLMKVIMVELNSSLLVFASASRSGGDS